MLWERTSPAATSSQPNYCISVQSGRIFQGVQWSVDSQQHSVLRGYLLAVVLSCKSALSVLIFLAKPLALFQGPAKSWRLCPQLQHQPLCFYLGFSSLISMEGWTRKSLTSAWWELIRAEHELLLLTLSSFLDSRVGLPVQHCYFGGLFGNQSPHFPSYWTKDLKLHVYTALER